MNTTSKANIEKKLEAFNKKIQAEAKKLFGSDEEGRAFVVTEAVDIRVFQKSHYFWIPRDLEDSYYSPYSKKNWAKQGHTQKEELERTKALLENKADRMRYIAGNLETATNEITWLVDEAERALRK